jgi:alpha-amylase
LDFRPANVTLVNSIERRPEPYHERLREARTGEPGGVVSIHEQVRVKEEGLERRLRYDRWPRHSFRLLLFSPAKTYNDYEAVQLEESAGFAGGVYEVSKAAKGEVGLLREAPLEPSAGAAGAGGLLKASKTFLFGRAGKALAVACNLSVSHRGTTPLPLRVGVEVIVNLLAPEQPDRYFETRDGRHPLRWGAALPASELRIVDEWQNVAVTVQAPGANEFWVAPVETISESEEGFERVYQGSEILAVWAVELKPGAVWTGSAMLRVALAR